MTEKDTLDTNTPDSQSSSLVDPAELVHLLSTPTKGSDVWQEQTARLVGKAHVRTLASSSDDLTYLRDIALLGWAQYVGVIAAKKKVVTLQRFRSHVPPPVSALDGPELRYQALRMLSAMRADWCLPYVAQAIITEPAEKRVADTLCSWALINCETFAQFLDVVVRPLSNLSTNDERIEAYSKTVKAQSSKPSWDSTRAAAKDFADCLQLVGDVALLPGVTKEVQDALWPTIEDLEKNARRQHPLLIVEPAFIAAVALVATKLERTQLRKKVDGFRANLCKATVSCLNFLADRHGAIEVERIVPLVPHLKVAYPDFAKVIARMSKQVPALAGLLEDALPGKGVSLEDAAASIYSRLLPNWHAFLFSYSKKEELIGINSSLLEAAGMNGVEFLGQADDLQQFDPILHTLQNGDLLPGSPVRLIRPAIIFRRLDASYRVITPALAVPA
jgi:hypothetical protein